MGVVYKILFPCGRFYIGATDNILQRISQHYSAKSSVGDLVKKYKMSIDDLMDLVTFLYDGNNYKSEETQAIYSNRNDPYILNKLFPKDLSKSSNHLCFNEIYAKNKANEPYETRRNFIRRAQSMYPDDLLLVSCDKLQKRIDIVMSQKSDSALDIYEQLQKMEKTYEAMK
jgi:hypothetical protein